MQEAMKRAFWKFGGDLTVVHGGANGADRMAGKLAEAMCWPVVVFPAHWESYGRAAGPIRNQEMLDKGKPDFAIAAHRNLSTSKGTADMVRRLERAGVPYELVP